MKPAAPARLLITLAACLLLALGIVTACAPAAGPPAPAAPEAPTVTELPPANAQPEEPAAEEPAAPAATEAPAATTMPLPLPTQAPSAAEPEAPAAISPTPELRVVELEWPESLRLGDSDVIRLSLIPSDDGYTARTEYDEHTVASQDVPVSRPQGYTLSAAARLDGATFDISPAGEQSYLVAPGETVTWRWSLSPREPGRQRLSIRLLLRWQPDPGTAGPARESLAYDRGLEIRVTSFLGLGKPAALTFGIFGMALSAVLGLRAWGRPARKRAVTTDPNPGLTIEAGGGMALGSDETKIMQSVFKKYGRLILEREFMSGYSGARTFLARPVLPGGQADADTIIKIGPRPDIEAEYDHYETYVKDRLPPITARIQSAPVTARGSARAGLRYTCISEPGRPPVSLRQALLAKPDPGLIRRLFDSFGPYWWMQRRPHTFRLAEEYDRLLPPLLVLEPVPSGTADAGAVNLGRDLAASERLTVGQLVKVGAYERFETRSDGRSLTLFGAPRPGQGQIRLRWLSPVPPGGRPARVAARRTDLFLEYTAGLDLFGLPDPLARLDERLQGSLAGTRSIIHGDLNLENILVGPGDLVWLIDFAQTREGHPLFDFAHLASELIGHVLVERYSGPQDYLDALRDRSDPLLEAVGEVAAGCLFNRSAVGEYHLALTMACLGALKYQNLSAKARHFLYLTAAYFGS